MSNVNGDREKSCPDGLHTGDVIVLTGGDEAVTASVVYLSPHLDDVVLSCGGSIHRQVRAGTQVLVATIFAANPSRSELSPFAAKLHIHWGHLREPVAVRRQEDEKAMRLVGAGYVHLEYLDAIYRFDHNSFLYLSNEDLFGLLHTSDLALVGQIIETVTVICHAQVEVIYAPLGVGSHVDHQLVREAAMKLHNRSSPVVFYEDYPYAEVPGALTRELERTGIEGWTEDIKEFEEEDLAAKVEAISAYDSQMDKLFQGVETMLKRVPDYASAVSRGEGYGERYWRYSHDAEAETRSEPLG